MLIVDLIMSIFMNQEFSGNFSFALPKYFSDVPMSISIRFSLRMPLYLRKTEKKIRKSLARIPLLWIKVLVLAKKC